MSGQNILPLIAGAGIALLAACAGPPAQSGPLGVVPQAGSWMDAVHAKQSLLYVSNGDEEVTVYDYSTQKLVGVLTDFTQPMGECTDNSGNVYITDYSAKQILEYAHGGSKPIKKLSDSPDSPYTCAVDPTTGNLAVANDDGSSQEGNIAIWAAGSGEPVTYTDSQLYNFEGCAYDGSGNLLVTDGNSPYPYSTYFAWLPKSGTKLLNIDVPGPEASWSWHDVEGIQWDGRFFVLDAYTLYRVNLIHGQAYYVGKTELDYPDEEGPDGPVWIYDNKPGSQGTQVVDGVYGDGGSLVAVWDYPAGGEPTAGISHGIDRPFAVVVSLAKTSLR